MSASVFHAPAAWGFTARETFVLNLMLSSRETASKAEMMDALYGDDPKGGAGPKILDVYACRLRAKLGRHIVTEHEPLIETIRGRGFRISAENKALIRAHGVNEPVHTEEAA